MTSYRKTERQAGQTGVRRMPSVGQDVSVETSGPYDLIAEIENASLQVI